MPINIDPTLVTLGPFAITWHGLFTAVGVAAGVWLAFRLAATRGHDLDQVMNVAMWGIVGAVIGARLVHVIDYWSLYSQDPLLVLRIYEGGLAIWGALIGGPLAGAIYAGRKQLPIGKLADLATPALALGLAIGRIGDIINGEHRGAPADGFPFSVVYVHPNTLGEIGKPVHLAVGYQLVWDLVLVGLTLWLLGFLRGNRSRLPAPGMVFWTFVLLYSVGNFFIHFFRLDNPYLWDLAQAQVLAIAGAIVSVWLLAFLFARWNRQRPNVPEERLANGPRVAPASAHAAQRPSSRPAGARRKPKVRT